MRSVSLSLPKQGKDDRKPLVQAILEKATGRNLDPVQVIYSSESEPVGKGYFQSIEVRQETNLRTGNVQTTRTRGNVV